MERGGLLGQIWEKEAGWLFTKSGEDSEITASQKVSANWPGHCIREGVEV
jgi:hypothetical protein